MRNTRPVCPRGRIWCCTTVVKYIRLRYCVSGNQLSTSNPSKVCLG